MNAKIPDSLISVRDFDFQTIYSSGAQPIISILYIHSVHFDLCKGGERRRIVGLYQL